MQPQRRQEDATVVEFSFHHIDAVNVHRPCGAIENRLFSMPLTSAFHSYHGDLQHQLSCDADHYQEHQTGRSDEDDVHNTGGNDHDVTAGDDGLRGEDGTSDRRGGDTKHDVVVGGAPVTPRKQHYSVAELLRDDRPEVGPPDSRRHDEPRTSPSQPADSAFHISWNVEQAGRPTAPLPPLFGPPTAHNHRWTEWIASEAWRRSEFDDGTRQRCFGLFDTPSVNFVSSYMTGNIRHSTELQLPLSASAQQYSTVSTPHRPLTGEKRDHQQHQQQQQQQQHDSVGRRQRTTFSAEQTLQLEVEYQRVEYVARPRRCELAQSLGLTDTQVKIWFQNRRAKDKRIEKAHVDRHIRSMQMMYSLNKNKGCLLDHVVDAHSRPSLPLPTARSLHPTTLRDARRNAIHRNWQTMH